MNSPNDVNLRMNVNLKQSNSPPSVRWPEILEDIETQSIAVVPFLVPHVL